MKKHLGMFAVLLMVFLADAVLPKAIFVSLVFMSLIAGMFVLYIIDRK